MGTCNTGKLQVMHMCAATFSLLSLLPLTSDDIPAGEAVGGEHVVGEDSDEHVVGEVGEEHVVVDVSDGYRVVQAGYRVVQDLPAGEVVGGEHVEGEDSDEHVVGEVGEEHVVAVSIVCTGTHSG